jgi:hypothetical protein
VCNVLRSQIKRKGYLNISGISQMRCKVHSDGERRKH